MIICLLILLLLTFITSSPSLAQFPGPVPSDRIPSITVFYNGTIVNSSIAVEATSAKGANVTFDVLATNDVNVSLYSNCSSIPYSHSIVHLRNNTANIK